MVAEPWLLRMGNQVSSNLKQSLPIQSNAKKSKSNHDDEHSQQVLGIMSFEIANLISKTVHLHKSLTVREISKLKNEISKSDGLRNLVSPDESHLLELALFEKLHDLNQIAGVVSRFGKKCTVPVLQRFEHVYGDIVKGDIDVKTVGFLVKDMEGMMRKMERYVNSTANLYREMAILNELEKGTKKFLVNNHEETRKVFDQKLQWKMQDVRHLKESSLWNQTYDKVVELLARTVCTIYAQLIDLKTTTPLSPKSRSVTPSSTTIGGSGLALHYANVIITIEKFLFYPNLVGEEEARDNLYQMLPRTIRRSLKTRMKKKSISKSVSMISEWRTRVEETARWIGPLAHKTVRWESERNFEQQQLLSRTSNSVMLMQTLYYGDRTKVEDAICDLLVGLNYICYYEHQQQEQQNILLDCAGSSSSFDVDDFLEWQLDHPHHHDHQSINLCI